jgi:uncharacterized membrane protein YphA (DoxX/SURF4 family)
MFQSIRHSQWALRAGLVVVFLWFGIDKFIHAQYWLDAWVPQGVEAFVVSIGIGATDLMYLMGIFEVLIATSLATGFFMRFFAAAASVFLVALMLTHGISEVLVRDVGLLGGLVALTIWPERPRS